MSNPAQQPYEQTLGRERRPAVAHSQRKAVICSCGEDITDLVNQSGIRVAAHKTSEAHKRGEAERARLRGTSVVSSTSRPPNPANLTVTRGPAAFNGPTRNEAPHDPKKTTQGQRRVPPEWPPGEECPGLDARECGFRDPFPSNYPWMIEGVRSENAGLDAAVRAAAAAQSNGHGQTVPHSPQLSVPPHMPVPGMVQSNGHAQPVPHSPQLSVPPQTPVPAAGYQDPAAASPASIEATHVPYGTEGGPQAPAGGHPVQSSSATPGPKYDPRGAFFPATPYFRPPTQAGYPAAASAWGGQPGQYPNTGGGQPGQYPNTGGGQPGQYPNTVRPGHMHSPPYPATNHPGPHAEPGHRGSGGAWLGQPQVTYPSAAAPGPVPYPKGPRPGAQAPAAHPAPGGASAYQPPPGGHLSTLGPGSGQYQPRAPHAGPKPRQPLKISKPGGGQGELLAASFAALSTNADTSSSGSW